MTVKAPRRCALLLASVAAIALGGYAPSAIAKDARDEKIEQLEKALQALATEVQALKQNSQSVEEAQAAAHQAQEAAKTAADTAQAAQDQLVALKTSTADQYADLQNQRNSDVKVSIANGRPVFASADGRFSAQLRAIMQYDMSYYGADKKTALASDLSSGTNFRRARFGVEGKAFGDWSYGFIYDFGGSSGTEQQGRMSDSYIQYDGLAPFHFKSGAFAPNVGIDDSGTGDLLFPERVAPADLARGIAAADGRQNYLNIFSYDNDYLASVSWTGAKSSDSIFFDEQQAVVGRASYRVFQDLQPNSNSNAIISANATYVFKVADTAASPAGASPITLQIVPENYVDATKLISTGAINASSYFQWGLEAAGNIDNFYAQAGYFDYRIDRRDSVLSNPNFDGWYAQGSWIITGESRRYAPATASWAGPSPNAPVDINSKGIGAWELAARYSDVNLNYNEGVAGAAAPANGIRGGEQKAWTFGLNWYPNTVVRLEFDYQNVNVSRLAAAAPFAQIKQKLDILSTRVQVAF